MALTPLAGCDESFSPIEPSELHYSIFGYLNAAADTQWIRIMPIRPLLPTAPGPLGASVTLENLESGQVVELRDSVFRFATNGEVGSEGVFLHNYWTTAPIDAGATYRFRAVGEKGEPAEAVVEVPGQYEVEVWLAQPWTSGGDRLHLVGVNHLAFVRGSTFLTDECGPAEVREPFETGSPHADIQNIPLTKRRIPRLGCGLPVLERREIFIAASGAEWPSGDGLAPQDLGVPDAPTNISNSVGFLGGILTRSVPYEECSLERLPTSPDHCRLRYDEDSATLSGTVTDVVCTREPLIGVAVALREIDPQPPEGRKHRSTSTGSQGQYRISGLEPGRRYHLSVRRFSLTDPYDQFREHTDTVAVSAGDHLIRDVPLERYRCEP